MTKIAVLSDIHFLPEPVLEDAKRQTDLGAILLQRAVWRLNQAIRPDVTVVLGDLLNLADGCSNPELLRQLQTILRKLESPCLVIPGNHDGLVSDFIDVFGPVPDWVDLAGIRFLPFLDEARPGFNAHRSAVDIGRFARARQGWAGPIVSLQHVPLMPPDLNSMGYRLINDAEAVAAMHASNITLALSGHYHAGHDLVSDGRAGYAVVPALCDAPFAFFEINLDSSGLSAVRHELALPEGLGLVDSHTHSPYAYCSENMNIATSARLARLFRLGGLAVTEHADHLYASSAQIRRSEQLFRELPDLVSAGASRMAQYWADAETWRSDFVRVGLEVCANCIGGVIADPLDIARCDVVVGAVHYLQELMHDNPDPRKASDEFLGMVRALLKAGAHVLAHPFRVFRWGKFKIEPPPELLEAVVDLLCEYGVAAELNSHRNQPIPSFVEQCLERGVPLSMASDAHNLAEIGYFFPQIELVRSLGGEVKAFRPGK